MHKGTPSTFQAYPALLSLSALPEQLELKAMHLLIPHIWVWMPCLCQIAVMWDLD